MYFIAKPELSRRSEGFRLNNITLARSISPHEIKATLVHVRASSGYRERIDFIILGYLDSGRCY